MASIDENYAFPKAKRRSEEIKLNPIKGNFDIAHLKAIHAYLFQDYPDNPDVLAGQFRPNARGDWRKQREFETIPDFYPWVAYSPMDKASQEKLSEILNEADPIALSQLDKAQFTKEMASLYANLDYIHPFREGNSRTLRAFTQQLSSQAGYDLRWERFNRLADRKGRDLLYIARDLAVNKIALPHIRYEETRTFVEGSLEALEGNKNLESLLASAVTAKNWRLNRNIEHLLSHSQNQPLSPPSLSSSKEESVKAMPSASTSKTFTSSAKQSFAEEFASKIIEQLEEGTAPWVRPFEAGELDFPYNGKTGDKYRGSNVLRLMMENRSDPRWMTYKQAQELGAQVRKGEKSTRLLRIVYDKEVLKKDENGKVLKDEDGKALKERVKLDRPYASSFVVFNAEQIDGLPELVRPEPDPDKEFKANARGEAILKASGAEIEHKRSARAFYAPREDKITLPEKEQFHSESGYYSTALHELGHWTGHESRLNRDLKHPFGSMGYAKEELRAEIGSMMLAMELGTGFDPGNHVAYIQSWIKALKEDPEEIVKACRDAEKIKNTVLGFEKQIEQEVSIEKSGTSKNASLPSVKDLDPTHFEMLSEDLLSSRNFSLEEMRAALLDAAAMDFIELDTELRHFELNTFDQYHAAQKFTEEYESAFQAAAEKWIEKQGQLTPQIYDDLKEIKEQLPNLNLASETDYVSAEISAAQHPIASEKGKEFKGVEISFPTQKERTEDTADLEMKEKAVHLYNERHGLEGDDEIQFEDDGTISVPGGSDSEFEKASAEIEQISSDLKKPDDMPDKQTAQKAAHVFEKPYYLNVPYAEKDAAKELGAQWSRKNKAWFIPAGASSEGFEKWMTPHPLNKAPRPDKIYLAVPAPDISEVKRKGAQFDEEKKAWFIDTTKKFDSSLEQWRMETIATHADARKYKEAPVSKEDSLHQALSDAGLKLNELIFDGKAHRVPTLEDKGKQTSGWYAAFENDGRPAAVFENYRSGLGKQKWVFEGKGIQSKAEIEAAKLVAAERRASLERAREELEAKTAEKVSEAFKTLNALKSPTVYMQNKGITLENTANMKVDSRGNLVVPMIDANGKQWSQQKIFNDGGKRFEKNGKKDGCFFPFNGIEALKKAPAIIITEGVATGASIHAATINQSNIKAEVIAAFDSGNLLPVARAIREHFPEKPILIAGDDDAHLKMTQGKNIGKEKATEAAKEVGGKAIFPIFSKEDKSWPKDVPKFTPKEYRSGNISQAQKEALAEYKKLTDYNDLATKTGHGKALLANAIRGELSVLKTNRNERSQEKSVSFKKEKTPPTLSFSKRSHAGIEH